MVKDIGKRRQVWKPLGKKGSIPVISELLHIFLNITPRPILLLIFILLTALLAQFFVPLFLSLVGYQCATTPTGQNELYQLPILTALSFRVTNLFTPSLILSAKPLSYEVGDDMFRDGDRRFLKIPETCIVSVPNETSVGVTHYIRGYTSSCVNCHYMDRLYFGEQIRGDRAKGICVKSDTFLSPTEEFFYGLSSGDGYRREIIGGISNIISPNNVCTICAPPPGYYFNYSECSNPSGINSTCYFRVIDEDGVNAFTSQQVLNQINRDRIIEMGGIVRTQSKSEMVSIQCDDRQIPGIEFFGIPLFNPTMWVFLLIGYMLIVLAFFYYNMIGLNR